MADAQRNLYFARMLRRALCLALWAITVTDANARGEKAEVAFAPLQFSDKGTPDPKLEGAWKLIAMNGVRPIAKKRWPGAFQIKFSAGEVTGKEACNGFFGPYRAVGNRVETALGETTAECRKPLPDEWESATLKAIEAGEFALGNDGRSLTFRGKDGRTYLFVREH